MGRLIRLENNITMTKDLKIKQVTFPENNQIMFGQDFSWWAGIPSDRVFTVRHEDLMGKSIEVTGEMVWLSADGYGGQPGTDKYGNGSICVYRQKDYPGWPVTEQEFIECLKVYEEKGDKNEKGL